MKIFNMSQVARIDIEKNNIDLHFSSCEWITAKNEPGDLLKWIREGVLCEYDNNRQIFKIIEL